MILVWPGSKYPIVNRVYLKQAGRKHFETSQMVLDLFAIKRTNLVLFVGQQSVGNVQDGMMGKNR